MLRCAYKPVALDTKELKWLDSNMMPSKAKSLKGMQCMPCFLPVSNHLESSDCVYCFTL